MEHEGEKKKIQEIRVSRVGELESWGGGGLCGSRREGSDQRKVCPAAEKDFKYSSSTRSGPINGKSFFDDGEISHVGHDRDGHDKKIDKN